MDRGAERDRRRDAGRRDDAQSSRHHRGARERPRRPLGQCGADGGRPIAPPSSTGSRRSCRRASTTRLSYGRGGRPSRARSAPWPASAESTPTTARRPTIRRFNARCDLLVIGAGAAGLAAANAAALAGRTVFLIDDHPEIGGQLAHRGGTIDGGDWREWARERRQAVEAAGGRVMTRTTAYGVYDGNLVCAWERRAPLPDALWRIRPKEIVVAAGAIERPLVVADNDRPGVMSADAALVYLRRYAVLVGKRIVVATNNDSAYPVAEALAEAGAEVEILDTRADGPPSRLKVTRGAAIEGVIGARGVEAVRAGGQTRDCDALLLSGGWSPTVHLYAQARGKSALRRGAGRARAGRRGRGPRRRRRRQRRLHPRRSVARGPSGGRRRRRRAERAGRPVSHRSLLAQGRRRRPALDRFPERRDAEGRRARRARGLRLGRAPQALHHARHGDRSGQDRQCQRPRRDGGPHRPHHRRDRNDDLSPAVRPRADGRHRRPAARRAHQSAAALAARGRAPGRRRADARIRRLAEARLVRAGRSRAFDPARGGAGARCGRAVRRLVARQDRGHRPGRGETRRLSQL